MALEQAIQVHLLEGLTPVLGGQPGKFDQIPNLRISLGATVPLDPADHHIGATFFPAPPLIEHGVGLADSRSSAEIQP